MAGRRRRRRRRLVGRSVGRAVAPRRAVFAHVVDSHAAPRKNYTPDRESMNWMEFSSKVTNRLASNIYIYIYIYIPASLFVTLR